MKDAVAQGGPGAFLLFAYIYASLFVFVPSIGQGLRIFVSASAAFLFSVILELGSDVAVGFISFPIVVRTKQEIDELTGEGEFYWDHEAQQEQLDKFDEQVFRYTVLIYAGILICLSLPALGYLYSLRGFVVAIGGSILTFSLFIYLPFKKMRNIIQTSVKLYG